MRITIYIYPIHNKHTKKKETQKNAKNLDRRSIAMRKCANRNVYDELREKTNIMELLSTCHISYNHSFNDIQNHTNKCIVFV